MPSICIIKRSRQFCRAAAVIALIALTVMPAHGQRASRLYPDTESLLSWRTRSGFDVYHLPFGGRDFRIPHLSHLRISLGTLAKPSTEVSHVTLYLMLPELRPLGRTNPDDYQGLGWGNMISLNLDYRQGRTPVEEIHRLDLDRRPHLEDPAALERMLDRYSQEWVYRMSQDGTVEFLARCNSGRTSDSCTAYFYAADHIFVHYTYSKALLAGWKQIDARVRALVDTFFE